MLDSSMRLGNPKLHIYKGFCFVTRKEVTVSPINSTGRAYVSDLLPRAWLAPKRATDQQCIKYCSKEDNFVSCGVPPVSRDISTLDEFVEDLKKDGDFSSVAMRHPTKALIYMKNAKILHNFYHEGNHEYAKPRVSIIYGSTGTGKTRSVYLWAKNQEVRLFVKNSLLRDWWDGYNGEEAVLFDDFRPGHFRLSDLLQLLDGYGLRVPVKTAHTWFKPRYIFFTSDRDPRMWYRKFDQDPNVWAQFRRRISKIECTDVKPEPRVVDVDLTAEEQPGAPAPSLPQNVSDTNERMMYDDSNLNFD